MRSAIGPSRHFAAPRNLVVIGHSGLWQSVRPIDFMGSRPGDIHADYDLWLPNPGTWRSPNGLLRRSTHWASDCAGIQWDEIDYVAVILGLPTLEKTLSAQATATG